MKQKDIERVMEAAWAAVKLHNAVTLRHVLVGVDPNGVYRPRMADKAQGLHNDEPYVPLRQSPRFIRPANEAGTHD